MKKSTVFVYKPHTLQDVVQAAQNLRELREQHGLTTPQPEDYYTVCEHQHLSAAEWADFTNDLLRSRDWLKDYSLRHWFRRPYCYTLRVTGDGAPFALLVDTEGRGYARYVGIEPTY